MATMWISVGLSILRKSGIDESIMSEIGNDKMIEWLLDIENTEIPVPKGKILRAINERATAYKNQDVLTSMGPELFSLLKSKYSSSVDRVVFIVSKDKKNLVAYYLINQILKKIISDESKNITIDSPIIIDDLFPLEKNSYLFRDALSNLWMQLDSRITHSKNNILSIIGGLKSITTSYYQWAMQSSNDNKILYAFNEWSKPIEILLPKIRINVSKSDGKEFSNKLVITIGTQIKYIDDFLKDKIKCGLLEEKVKNNKVINSLQNTLHYINGESDNFNSAEFSALSELLIKDSSQEYKGLLGPEIRAISWFVKNHNINNVVLLHSDLDHNSRIAELVKIYTESIGVNASLIPFSKNIGDINSLQEGIDSLLNSCVQSIEKGDFVFSVGGYKHAIAIVSTHALSVGAKCFYMHKDWKSPDEVYPHQFLYSKEWAFSVLEALNKNNEEYRILEEVLWTGNGKSFDFDRSILIKQSLKGIFNYDTNEKSVSLSGMGKIVQKVLKVEFDKYEDNYGEAINIVEKLNIPKRKNQDVIVTGGIHGDEYSNKCYKIFSGKLLIGIEKLRGSKKDLTGLIDLSKSNINRLVKINKDPETGIIDLNLYCHLPYKSESVQRYNHIIYADGLNTLYRNYFIGIILKKQLIKNVGLLDYK